MESESKSRSRPLQVEVEFTGQERDESLPPVRAYLFDREGKLIESARVEKGIANLPANARNASRLVVGPDLIGSRQETPADLAQQLAQAKAVSRNLSPDLQAIRVPLSKYIWFCWWETCIVVYGTVRKLLNPGSPNPTYAPICLGVVQIFQVDLACTLDTMTSFQVITLRDLLVQRLRGLELAKEKLLQLRGPIPPGPPPEAKAIGSATARLRQSTARSETGGKAMQSSMATAQATEKAQVERITRISPRRAVTQNLPLAETATQLSLLEGAALKNSILVNKLILWPIICQLIPDWAFCWQELGEVPLQSDGSFMAEICFWCPDDYPDLYFEVVQTLDGISREIYDPPIACTTYFNYDGSQSVDIVIDDPQAVACMPNPTGPNYLFVHPLGFYETSLGSIIALETDPSDNSNPDKGKVPWTQALGNVENSPWGATLPIKLDYHPGMFGYYYRWWYKFDGDANFTPLNADVTHYYRVWDNPALFIGHWEAFHLGPQTIGGQTNLYAFPDKSLDWRVLYDADIMFGYFDSTAGQTDPSGYDYRANDGVSNRKSGMCTLVLEVFDGAGNYVTCNNVFGTTNVDASLNTMAPAGNPFTFLLPQLGGPPESFDPAPTTNVTISGRLVFRIYVNNNTTVAKLPAVTDATGTANECGFLQFASGGETVSIKYDARHHQGYLDWRIDVFRGLCGVAAQLPGIGNSPGSPVPPGLPASFDNPADLLLGHNPPATCGNCPDGAAFAVNLYTWGWATNGRYRIGYDDMATIAFALLHT